MNNKPEAPDELPEAKIQEAKGGLPMIWLLPLVAVLIGAWLVYKTFTEQGPTITIQFQNAEGIEPSKTKIKYRNVDVGVVKDVAFGKDLSHVIITVEMEPGSRSGLTDTARFWVVRPRIGTGGVSGIDTLLSGAYIAMDPGKGGESLRRFKGLEEPPPFLSDTPGTLYRLKSRSLGSLAEGSPVYFRQIRVGKVVGYKLVEDHSHVEIEIFVHAPHDQYIRSDTRFWNVSGVEMSLSAQGLDVEMASLVSLLSGGVAFETPASGSAEQPAPADTEFVLYKNYKASQERAITFTVPYLLFFDQSVRGLSIGAPVEYRGIRVGSVKDIDVEYERDPTKEKTAIAVEIELEPQRVSLYRGKKLPEAIGQVDRLAVLVKRGLRARLKTGNLLTGQLFVDFDVFPYAEPAEITIDKEKGIPVLPTVPGELAGATRSINAILAKLEGLPIDQIGRDVQQALVELNSVLKKTDAVLDSLAKASGDVQPLLGASTATLKQAQATLNAMEGAVTDRGPMGSQLLKTLEELTAAVRSVRIMAEYLQRHPEALLRGKERR
jgi:paraquat-inducible protein B